MSKTINLKCIFGNIAVPVTLEIVGDKIWVRAPFHRGFTEEVKSMKGAKWHPELKIWSIDNCKRNLYAFDILTNSSKVANQYWSPERYFTPNCEIPLWKHQHEMYNFIMSRRRCVLGAEMRTGKTRPTLQSFLDSEHALCWLITTKSAFPGIFRECTKWFKGKILAIEYGKAVLKTEGKILVVMTYDRFSSVMQEWPMGKTPPGFVVFDECQKLKTPSSLRTEMAMKLVYSLIEPEYKGREYVIGLSGTPAPKNPVDWWSQCEVIRSGFIREGDIKKMEWRIGIHEKTGAAGEFWKLTGWKEEEVNKLSLRLRGLVKIWFLVDCIADLPEKRYEIVHLEPSEELLRVAEFLTETEESAVVLRNRLRQLSDGFQYEKEYDPVNNKMIRSGFTYVGSPKEGALINDLEEHEDVGRLVVYSGFQGSVDIISKICLEHGWTVLQMDGRRRVLLKPDGSSDSSEAAINVALGEMDRSTNTYTVEKLVVNAQTDAAGTGLEFSASPTIIYYSNSDSGEGRMQSEARGYSANMDKVRGGLIKDYCHLPSDYAIRETLRNKKDLQALSMGAMKELFANKKGVV